MLHQIETVIEFNFLNNEIPEVTLAINKEKVVERCILVGLELQLPVALLVFLSNLLVLLKKTLVI